MIRMWWQEYRALVARRRSMGWMLQKPDDRMIRDIGFTRSELQRFLDGTGEASPPAPEGSTECGVAPGAGSRMLMRADIGQDLPAPFAFGTNGPVKFDMARGV